jgi:asparagine synthase (glutamine-hydrolysing)
VGALIACLDTQGAPADTALLVELAARGPDARGTWSAGPMALGHAALWTTPEAEREHQPARDAANALALVFEGRLDGREELIEALDRAGERSGRFPR